MIEQKVKLSNQQDFTLAGCLKQVEKCGRICYKSEGKITEDSYKDFTKMLVRNGHYSPFGHGTLILDLEKLKEANSTIYMRLHAYLYDYPLQTRFYITNPYRYLIVSARVLIESSIKESIRVGSDDKWVFFNNLSEYIVDTDNNIEESYKRITFKITTSIAMTRELNRHGVNLDITERSTRYVKAFDWIKPCNWNNIEKSLQDKYKTCSDNAILNYVSMLEDFSKQEARDVLPLNTVTEVYYTAFRYQWEDVINKRTCKGVHPQMIELINQVKELLKKY